ncbi:fimbrin-1 [Selaginella moellendorffii]|uniref:fimbrin-1 n=1 Tax=Selaginella moellendorffii TaxID=88036 RepID=UPI000D1C5BB5|nr:fimbrin-1 [Selaginella moellendorffii]|eukprot:XP_024545636.1 fimbrin-1 [Selaginella moellendorffii]
MAAFGGVVVSDPLLASQFTQNELRSLKSEFESLGSSSDVITAKEFKDGLSKLAFIQEPLTEEEVASIVKERSSSLDFEAFLSIYLEMQKSGVKISPQKSPASEFLKRSTTTLIHTVHDSEKKAYADHINSHLADDPDLRDILPIDSSTDDLFDAVQDGILICKLINVAVPGTIDERALNMKKNLNPWEKIENQTLCLNSAKAIGCSVVNIGTEDLIAGRSHLVLGLLSQIIKIQLLSGVNLKAAPELAEMLNDTEDIEELLRLPAEKVLLKWVNYHLQKAGFSREITNFSSDLKDGEAYSVLLNVLAPESCDLSPLDLQDPYDRAKAVLAQAERINCRKYLTPRDITCGSANLNLAFLAYLFHERNGLTADNSLTYAELIQDHEQDSRDERVFRVWINSLGTTTYVDQLFDGVWDGWILLEILDKLEPGSINWKAANKPPIKMPFKKVENCNQAIDAARKLRLSLVNVAGSDIVQGNRKLILAFLWQLMRYHTLQLLKNIKLRGKEVSDYDILKWANNKVKRSGKDSRMESFKDKSLSSGIFFLDLLWAVEPRVVNWQLVTKGVTDDEKKQNAVYVISVARKLGCSVFLLWDDIVEVRPKMVMILAATVMLWSLGEKAKKAANTAAVLELHNEVS